MPDKNGYPTTDEINAINNFNGPLPEFIKLLQKVVHYGDASFKAHGKNIIRMEFHTYGWSGNEEIESHLQHTFFWMFCWEKSLRGGHHYFKYDMRKQGKFEKWGQLERYKYAKIK